ncbi:hypothetical protein C0991_006151 [Blastosporella zonata]|nr:hypothetical protein C0991_006151 [Blastosporella zonata]
MSLLFRHLRVHHVFGANTDVGKTILTTALVRASAHNNPVFYLKPVSTGHPQDADTSHIKRHAASNRVFTECLYQYDQPVSPHLAAQLTNRPPISDDTLVNAIASYIRRTANASPDPAHLYVETAGGVHSPTLSGTTQVEAYRPLFLPTILIGDADLGGISTTIAAYEALLLRGYIVDAVLLFRDAYYRNAEYLKAYFADRGIWVGEFERPPQKLSGAEENFRETESYYQRLMSPPLQGGESAHDAVTHLTNAHTKRLEELDSMPGRTLKSVWWPFVQHAHITSENDVNVIDSARGDFFSVYSKHSTTSSLLSPQLDSSASWWTQTFGHAHTNTTLAAARAAGRYGHVMFPGATHLPALKLCEALLAGPGKGWANRVFISDNGSTGMEVGIKMALRAWVKKMGNNQRERLGVLGLTGSYHGDTIGAMDACEPGVYTCEWHDAKGVWLDPPTVAFRKGKLELSVPSAITKEQFAFEKLGDVYDLKGRIGTALEGVYRRYVEGVLGRLEEERRKKKEGGIRLAALVLEPLVIGAGGMRFVDPLFQRVLIDVVRSARPELGLCPAPTTSNENTDNTDDFHGLPVLFDEVFTGLYRLGLQSAGPLLGAHPDIAVNAKILTGGLVPLATTMAREGVFKAFWSPGKEGKGEALLHGHSYSAHAVGCEVALETLGEIGKLKSGWGEAREMWGIGGEVAQGQEAEDNVWSFWDPEFVKRLSEAEKVEEVMTLGCLLAIKVADQKGGTSHFPSSPFSLFLFPPIPSLLFFRSFPRLFSTQLKKSTPTGYTSHAAQDMLAPLKDLHLHSHAEDDHVRATQAPGGAPYAVHYRTLGNVAYFMTSGLDVVLPFRGGGGKELMNGIEVA